MKQFLIGLLVGELLGAGIVWFYFAGGGRQRADVAAQHIAQTAHRYQASDTPITDVMTDITGALPSWDTEAIQEELARTGQVIRRKTDVLAHVMNDATITARIKASLARDPDLSAWNISVNTTDRVVTLSGVVASPEQNIKAMQLAMATEGVVDVVSSLKIKPAPDR
jgi:hypothetical protein